MPPDPAPREEASAIDAMPSDADIDEIVRWLDVDDALGRDRSGTGPDCHLARIEAIAHLRRRIGDLELLLRWAIQREKPRTEICQLGRGSKDEGKLFAIEWTKTGFNKKRIPLKDDGTGLPLLTAEARAALRGKEPR